MQSDTHLASKLECSINQIYIHPGFDVDSDSD